MIQFGMVTIELEKIIVYRHIEATKNIVNKLSIYKNTVFYMVIRVDRRWAERSKMGCAFLYFFERKKCRGTLIGTVSENSFLDLGLRS